MGGRPGPRLKYDGPEQESSGTHYRGARQGSRFAVTGAWHAWTMTTPATGPTPPADRSFQPAAPAPVDIAGSETVLVISLLRALSVFRWATLAWACLGVALSRSLLTRPVLAVAGLAVAAAYTLYLQMLGRVAPRRLATTPILALELVLGMGLLLLDGAVYEPERAQSLPWAWPAAGIAAAGIARGTSAGLAAAAAVSAVSVYTEVVVLDRFSGPAQAAQVVSKVGLWLLVGALAGALVSRLRRAERLISLARARDELARELHDGVLQTLAIIQRRSDDGRLVALARDQENSLRAFLSDRRVLASAVDTRSQAVEVDVEPALRQVAAYNEQRYPLSVEVIVATDCPPIPAETVAALAGAVGEAVTNSSKHGGADRVTVYAEPADHHHSAAPGIFVSVKDNGAGFAADEVQEGLGLSKSIRARIEDVGGSVDVTARPGRGAEVTLRVPV